MREPTDVFCKIHTTNTNQDRPNPTSEGPLRPSGMYSACKPSVVVSRVVSGHGKVTRRGEEAAFSIRRRKRRGVEFFRKPPAVV